MKHQTIVQLIAHIKVRLDVFTSNDNSSDQFNSLALQRLWYNLYNFLLVATLH